MLHYHLTVLLFYLVALLCFFVLLIPAPFVDLGLCKSTCLTNPLTCIFTPTWVFVVFLHKILHLIWIFSISLLFISLYRDFLSNCLLTLNYLWDLWSCMERSAWYVHINVCDTLLVGTELSYFLKRINEQNLWN